jgi:hypothetical protein
VARAVAVWADAGSIGEMIRLDHQRVAAVVQREVLEVIEWTGPERSGIAVGSTRLARRCHRGHLSIRRIDDERRVPERPHAELVAKNIVYDDLTGRCGCR